MLIIITFWRFIYYNEYDLDQGGWDKLLTMIKSDSVYLKLELLPSSANSQIGLSLLYYGDGIVVIVIAYNPKNR